MYFIKRLAELGVLAAGSTNLLVRYPLCTIVMNGARRDSLSRQAAVLRERAMDNAYNTWIGQSVVLQVVLGDMKVPLRGKLLKDGGETLRMRIGDGWDVDIYKAMILAVEEDAMVLLPA
jgi:hypothetical protein